MSPDGSLCCCRRASVVPYQVAVHVTYVARDGASARLHTEVCESEQTARVFALGVLANAFMLIGEAQLSRRRFWCELSPVRWVDGAWEPVPAVEGTVDAAFLNSENGEITFDLAATLRRRRPRRVMRR